MKFYTSVAKELKLKAKNFWGANSNACRGYSGKADRGGGPFFAPHILINFRQFPVEKKVRMGLIFVITPGVLFGLSTEYFVSNIWN